MEASLAEMPLALFTTFCAIGAGSFVSLAFVLSGCNCAGDQKGSLNRVGLVPTAVVLLGFICAFFHLANPMHAIGVFAGIGSSPLSNELVVGCLFFVAALILCIVCLTNGTKCAVKKVMLAITAILGVVFAIFMGMAYMMPTIPSWNTIASPIQMLGYTFAGGAALAAVILAGRGREIEQEENRRQIRTVLIGASLLGLCLALGGLIAQFATVASLSNPMVSGLELANGSLACFIGCIVCLAVSVTCVVLSVTGFKNNKAIAYCALLFSFAGILLGRLMFYALQLSVGPVM